MNRQRKVVITVTYNDLGMIVDTKAEELDSSAQPERKKGKWLVYGDIPTTCSCCHEDWDKYVNGDVWYSDELPNYCPSCGSYNGGKECTKAQ